MVDKITHFPTGAASSIIALHIKDAVMLEIKHSCETLQQRQRWCVYPSASGNQHGLGQHIQAGAAGEGNQVFKNFK